MANQTISGLDPVYWMPLDGSLPKTPSRERTKPKVLEEGTVTVHWCVDGKVTRTTTEPLHSIPKAMRIHGNRSMKLYEGVTVWWCSSGIMYASEETMRRGVGRSSEKVGK